jgi:hypothetical protein
MFATLQEGANKMGKKTFTDSFKKEVALEAFPRK